MQSEAELGTIYMPLASACPDFGGSLDGTSTIFTIFWFTHVLPPRQSLNQLCRLRISRVIVQFLQNSGSMPKREYLSGILPDMENHFHTLSQAKPPVQGYYIKRRMLRCVSYGLKDVDICLRKILVGVVPSCSYFHTIE
jgi:hypothetical protein